jgi:hypothetical protein
MPHVIGYDTLNEPSPGYIGIERLSRALPVYNGAPQLTGFESLMIPAGFAREVPLVERKHLRQEITGRVRLNPDGVSAWRDPRRDVWRSHGVWDVDARGEPRLLRDDYFSGVKAFSDCMLPFARRYAEAMRAEHPDAIAFVEGEPGAAEPLRWDGDIPVVNASHWYDLLTLITKRYDPAAALVWGSDGTVTGVEAVRASFKAQIGEHVEASRRYLGGAPTLIGEFGLPYDLDGGRAYGSGDWSAQEAALASYYDALDANLCHSAHWNYTADNDNRWGDGWNQEDLSIFSRDQQRARPDDPDAGARALKGFCRPCVHAAAGTPVRQELAQDTHSFTLEIDVDAQVQAPTEVFVPLVHFPRFPEGLTVTSGETHYDRATQLLHWRAAAPGRQTLTIRR